MTPAPQPVRRLALVVNAAKPRAPQVADELALAAAEAGLEVRRTEAYPVPEGFLAGADACCVIGGDGSILGAVEEAARAGVPVLGVNLGKLGFMASYGADEARHALEALHRGHYRLSPRMLLRARAADGREVLALNDVVLRNLASRLVQLEVCTQEELVNGYLCDGLILSTPTGSTAYNLSAGGPIIHPEAPVFAVTPICPHTLSNRTVVLPGGAEIMVHLRGGGADGRVQVTADGRERFGALSAPALFPLVIRQAAERFWLIQAPRSTPFRIIRAKLDWGPA